MHKVATDRAADIAIKTLTQEDRKCVLQAMRHLEEFPQARSVKHPIQKIDGGIDLYSMRISDRLRLLFRYEQGKVVVQDVLGRDRLHGMFDQRWRTGTA